MAQRSEHQHRPASFYASPEEAARAAPPEMLLYLACLHRGTGVERPDFIAVVDADPDSDRCGEIVHEAPIPNIGDELHHFGGTALASCCIWRRPLDVPTSSQECAAFGREVDYSDVET